MRAVRARSDSGFGWRIERLNHTVGCTLGPLFSIYIFPAFSCSSPAALSAGVLCWARPSALITWWINRTPRVILAPQWAHNRRSLSLFLSYIPGRLFASPRAWTASPFFAFDSIEERRLDAPSVYGIHPLAGARWCRRSHRASSVFPFDCAADWSKTRARPLVARSTWIYWLNSWSNWSASGCHPPRNVAHTALWCGCSTILIKYRRIRLFEWRGGLPSFHRTSVARSLVFFGFRRLMRATMTDRVPAGKAAHESPPHWAVCIGDVLHWAITFIIRRFASSSRALLHRAA